MSTPQPPCNLFSVVANIERHKLASGEPFLVLMDVEYPGNGTPLVPGTVVAQQHVRFVNDINPFVFDAGDGNGAQTYLPFNFTVGEMKTGADGSVPSCEVQASNVMRALESVLEQYAGAVGANLYLYGVNAANPAGEPDLAMAFTVTSVSSDAKAVSLKLGASSPLRRMFPFFVYRPNFCGWQYNSPALQAVNVVSGVLQILSDLPGVQCGYVGSLTSCDHTIDGANGCKVHFPGQPLRGLFFPGIDTNGAVAGTVA